MAETCALDVADRQGRAEVRDGEHDLDGLPLYEIGDIYGLCRERIRQLEIRGLRKFRENWKILYGDEPPI